MIGLQTGLWPEALRAGYSLRPYQETGATAVAEKLSSHRSTLVVWATGLGKTVLFCEEARRRGGCLVIAHRDTLIRAAAEKLQLAAGPDEPVAIEKAQERAHFGAKFIVGSVQTLKGERLRRFALRFPSIEFIIFDEAHRATAKSYRDIMMAYPNAKLLFVTATPDRSDGVGLKSVCESVAHEYNIVDATPDGWLTPLRFVPVQSKIDLSGIKVTKQSDGEKDFDSAQLDSAVTREAGRIAAAVVKILRENPGARGIGFTPGVHTAHACATATNELEPGSAAVVDGEMTDAEKRPVLEAHREGRIRIVYNCNVLTEGYDDPGLAFVFDASPTHSRMRAAQRWGRVTRPFSDAVGKLATAEERRAAIAGSSKPWGIIYDLVSNSSEHDVVVDAIDLLAGKDLPPEVTKRAKEIIRTEGGTPGDAVARAEKETADKKRRAMAAKRIAAATDVTMGEPRSVFDRTGLAFIKRTKMAARPDEQASPKMLGLLRYRGIPIPTPCTKSMFRRLLNVDQKREKEGKCRLGGVDWLRTYGIDAWKMTRETALRVREAIRSNNFARLTPEQLGEAMIREPGEEG